MKRSIRIIVPILLALAIVVGSAWYLFIYDRAFTRDVLLSTARFFDEHNRSAIAGWFYDCAYKQAENNDIVAIELADQHAKNGNYTQAERTLSKAINNKPTIALYAALSRIYIEQDKVLDAVLLLDNIRDPEIIAQLSEIRPVAPSAFPESGVYSQYINVTVEGEGGKLYANHAKEYPSVLDDLYKDPIALTDGENAIYAVVISDEGVVSPLSTFAYTIGDVIEQIKFSDSVVEESIRKQLKVSEDQPLYTNNLWKIDTFTVPESAQTFADLKYLTAVKELNITAGPSGELSCLSSMKNLSKLSISNVNITDEEMKIIGGLTTLESLTLSNCGLSTTSGLETAVNLINLDLSNNTIRNLSSLSQMKKMEHLNLKRNALHDLQDLAECSALVTLDVSFNSLSSIAPIRNHSALRELNLGNNVLTSLPHLDKLTALEKLNVSHNSLTSAETIAPCTSLKELDISHNGLTDVGCLNALSALTVLNMSNNGISAIPSFDLDSALITIDCSNNAITSVSPLSGHHKLNNVIVDNNHSLSTLDPLSTCHVLVKVSAYGTAVNRVGELTTRGIVVMK